VFFYLSIDDFTPPFQTRFECISLDLIIGIFENTFTRDLIGGGDVNAYLPCPFTAREVDADRPGGDIVAFIRLMT
jgi:hypothetical protein